MLQMEEVILFTSAFDPTSYVSVRIRTIRLSLYDTHLVDAIVKVVNGDGLCITSTDGLPIRWENVLLFVDELFRRGGIFSKVTSKVIRDPRINPDVTYAIWRHMGGTVF